ncbi:MAG: class I tRNA ligase family protein, partial [Candidatus Dormibacteria bacterium]
EEPLELARARHRCIRDVTRDTPELKYNTAIAAMMSFVKLLQASASPVPGEAMETLALLLAPYCPHTAEELWERLGNEYSVHQQRWPKVDPEMLAQDHVVVVISINGKKRDQLQVAPGLAKDELIQRALASVRIQQFLADREPSRIFVVPDRQVNLVVAPD